MIFSIQISNGTETMAWRRYCVVFDVGTFDSHLCAQDVEKQSHFSGFVQASKDFQCSYHLFSLYGEKQEL